MIMGNLWDALEHNKQAKRSKEQTKAVYAWMVEQWGLKPEENEVILISILSTPHILISDPEMVKDLFTTKNPLTDKAYVHENLHKELLGEAILFTHGDENWKIKRKAFSHAFFTAQLKIMHDVLKEKIEFYFDKWNSAIEASSTKSHIVDLTNAFERIYARTLVVIAFGEDIYDQKFETKVLKTPYGSEFET